MILSEEEEPELEEDPEEVKVTWLPADGVVALMVVGGAELVHRQAYSKRNSWRGE